IIEQFFAPGKGFCENFFCFLAFFRHGALETGREPHRPMSVNRLSTKSREIPAFAGMTRKDAG
ncbi:hypothetical protein, partial [Fibrobacter sp.]|uniref:hypothetical protein n=1 Tax=Fibrobacter sp. TaxID=35828 RepID=UPI00388D96C6